MESNTVVSCTEFFTIEGNQIKEVEVYFAAIPEHLLKK